MGGVIGGGPSLIRAAGEQVAPWQQTLVGTRGRNVRQALHGPLGHLSAAPQDASPLTCGRH